jgi:predicted glycogen debranching enzyme
LVADIGPPWGRVVFLSKLDDWVEAGGARADLMVNEFEGALQAAALEKQTAFRIDPMPTYQFEVLGARLKKEIALPGFRGAVVVTYRHTGGERVTLGVRPLFAFRGYHALAHEPPGGAREAAPAGERAITVCPHPALPPVTLAWDRGRFQPRPDYWRRFRYRVEQERGLDCIEDLYKPGTLRVELGAGDVFHVVCALDPEVARMDPEKLRQKARARVAAATARAPELEHDYLGAALAQAADAFVSKKPGGETTLQAGYPWFTDWGRDAMIALPGLLLETGRVAEAREVLRCFAQSMSLGMIPNHFPDGQATPVYNTIDATLWFVEAARAYLDKSGDDETGHAVLFPAIREAVVHHLAGTRYGIGVDQDGLLMGGADGVQLTWMDAKVGDWVVTPRRGKPVEIQALWYNALCIDRALGERYGDGNEAARAASIAAQARASFEARFWLADRGYYADVVGADGVPGGGPGGVVDATLRPNQLLALSLTHPLVSGARAKSALAVCEQELLTPFGLRTRARGDGYIGQYTGDQRQRDAAYHQGTVWAWLLGPWADAAVRVDGEAGRQRVRNLLPEIAAHLGDACLGQISEVFDGDYPHRARGCVAQAWSVGEVLRVYRRYVLDGAGEKNTPPAHPPRGGETAR